MRIERRTSSSMSPSWKHLCSCSSALIIWTTIDGSATVDDVHIIQLRFTRQTKAWRGKKAYSVSLKTEQFFKDGCLRDQSWRDSCKYLKHNYHPLHKQLAKCSTRQYRILSKNSTRTCLHWLVAFGNKKIRSSVSAAIWLCFTAKHVLQGPWWRPYRR